MELSVIKASNDEIIVLENKTNRQFLIKCDQNNLTLPYGFYNFDAEYTNINPFEYILNKLNTNDYSFHINLYLSVMINFKNDAQNVNQNIIGHEIFPDADLNKNDDDMNIEDYKKIITSLRHQVNNLSYKLKDAELYIAYTKDELEYQSNILNRVSTRLCSKYLSTFGQNKKLK